MKGSSSLKMKENGINVATTALSPVKGQKRKWERELLNCQVAGAMDEDWRSCRLSPLCKMSRLAEEPTLSSSIIRMCQGHQELQWKWLLGWKRINRPGAAQIVILNTLNPVRLLSQLCCFFFWLRLVCCTLPVHRGLWEEHSWSLVLHRLLTAAHTRAASACNAYRNACYHLQRALMSATGSGTAAEHQNKMRFCLEKSPQPPQVSVLKEELELKPLWLPDVGETDVICRA